MEVRIVKVKDHKAVCRDIVNAMVYCDGWGNWNVVNHSTMHYQSRKGAVNAAIRILRAALQDMKT